MEIKCEKCQTLLCVIETKGYMPYRTEETAECPVCGNCVYKHNTRGDIEVEIISLADTDEKYKEIYYSKNK